VKLRSRLVTLLLVAVASTAEAQRYETGFVNRAVEVEGATYRYQVYVPADYRADAQWPVILFLHGAGERGTDGLIQTEVGLGSALRRHSDLYPAVIVFPQAPPGSRWTDVAARAALAALDRTLEELSTDPTRIYLTGLSMGGNGTWYLAYHAPDRFAALAPICGWVASNDWSASFLPDAPEGPYASLAERVRGIPTWIFHGETDPIVPVTESRQMAEALRGVGSSVTYTELPGTGHNSWDAAYGSPAFAEWLLSQRRR
jgi:predicted peptidase